MKKSTATIACALAAAASPRAEGFAVVPRNRLAGNERSSSAAGMTRTSLRMGLFDGVKDAFSAPSLAKSTIDSERETPIDRWMGWSVKSEEEQQQQSIAANNFVDAMDEKNYISVGLEKPMGIVFEENDEKLGGIFVLSLSEGGVAETEGTVQAGDELVAVGSKKVAGMNFDDALGTIIDSQDEKTKLIFFRGSATDLYGPTGASQEWMDDFISKHKSD